MAAALTIFKRFLRSNQNNVLLVNILTLILFLMVCVYFNDLVANFFNIGSIVRTTKIVVSALCSWILFTNFWMQSTFSFVLMSSSLKSFFLLAVSTIIFHLVAVLYGAPLFQSSMETYCFAVLLTSVTTLPCLCVLGRDGHKWERVFLHHSPENASETNVHITTLFSILGAWLGAFPIPLDWDRPWQVWPVSCVIGTLLGYAVGTLVATVHLTMHRWKDSKIKMR